MCVWCDVSDEDTGISLEHVRVEEAIRRTQHLLDEAAAAGNVRMVLVVSETGGVAFVTTLDVDVSLHVLRKAYERLERTGAKCGHFN